MVFMRIAWGSISATEGCGEIGNVPPECSTLSLINGRLGINIAVAVSMTCAAPYKPGFRSLWAVRVCTKLTTTFLASGTTDRCDGEGQESDEVEPHGEGEDESGGTNAVAAPGFYGTPGLRLPGTVTGRQIGTCFHRIPSTRCHTTSATHSYGMPYIHQREIESLRIPWNRAEFVRCKPGP